MTRRNVARAAGFTLFELLIVCAVISLIAAITVPRLIETRRNAQETSAIETVRVIAHAQVQYQVRYGNYAASMDELCTAGILQGPFATGLGTLQAKGGYEFGTCIPQDPDTSGGAVDLVQRAKSRFRVCGQPRGADQTQRITNGSVDFFELETGFMFEDAALPDAVLGNSYTVIQLTPDPEFGTTYPAIPN
jgi:prepilin-type N-terminal cleavage/methylation domain-containing protein